MLKIIKMIPKPILTALPEISRNRDSFQYYYIDANGSIKQRTNNPNEFDMLGLNWQNVEFNQDRDIENLEFPPLLFAVVNNHPDEYVFKYNQEYSKIIEYFTG